MVTGGKIIGRSWTYIKTVVDTVREPFLFWTRLRVMLANESFYRTFQVEKMTPRKNWSTSSATVSGTFRICENCLNTFYRKTLFSRLEVAHEFPLIGRKVMILNARQIFHTENPANFSAIILLAMEDVTKMMVIAENWQVRPIKSKPRCWKKRGNWKFTSTAEEEFKQMRNSSLHTL